MLFATLDATTRQMALPRRPRGDAHRHRRLHPQAAARARRGVQVHARRDARRGPARCTSSTRRTRSTRRRSRAVDEVLGEIGVAAKPQLRVYNKIDLLDARRAGRACAAGPRRRGVRVGGDGRGPRRRCANGSAPRRSRRRVHDGACSSRTPRRARAHRARACAEVRRETAGGDGLAAPAARAAGARGAVRAVQRRTRPARPTPEPGGDGATGA